MRRVIKARLKQLGVTAYLVSVRTGHLPGWLTQIMDGTDHHVATVLDVAKTLGLETSSLIDSEIPDFWPAMPG